RRLPCCRAPGNNSQQNVSSSPTARPAMEFGVHAIQPWFYSGMSRDEATHLLTKYGTVDGVFLVRESRRNPGSFVYHMCIKIKFIIAKFFLLMRKTNCAIHWTMVEPSFMTCFNLLNFIS
ncbi:growth factor receptor-bound protein 14, partial [Trichonephila clavata]